MIKCRCSDAESHEYDEYIRAKKLASWGKKFGRQNIGKIMHFTGREPTPNGQTRRGKTLFENYDSCKKNDILQLCANGRKRKVFANQVHELCAQLSDSVEKLANQEIAFFDTYSNFWETLIQKLFECFTSCCSSEY